MNLSLYIAKRYLFSKKSHQVINKITGVAIAGVALATAAMICALSVFNGFQGVVAEQFTAFDPDIRITTSKGKVFDKESEPIREVLGLPQVDIVSFSVEDKAMLEYNGNQAMVVVKGIDSSFTRLTQFENILYGIGELKLEDGINSYAVLGAELTEKLNCGISPAEPMKIYAPNRNGKVNMTVPARNFKKCDIFSAGLIFILNQPKYDANYVVTSDAFARKLFRREDNEANAMELKVKEGADIGELKETIQKTLGDGFTVQDRYEQQNDVYKVMQIEKLISYIFLTFILLIACINIIGSLAMLIIEKRDNMNTLRNLGAESKTIANIFVIEGCIISTIGAIAGIVIGLLLCFAQQEFGLISMGSADGFIVDSYPVDVVASDVLTVFITVMIAGFVAVWLPVKILTKRFV